MQDSSEKFYSKIGIFTSNVPYNRNFRFQKKFSFLKSTLLKLTFFYIVYIFLESSTYIGKKSTAEKLHAVI